jgi:hypothetical protein
VIGIGSGLAEMDVARLERLATQAIAELRRPDLAWLEPLAEGIKEAVDFEAVARSIEVPLLELQQVLAELPASLRRSQSALEAKQGQIATLQKEIQRSAAVLEGIYRFAGLEFHAERLRPKSRSASESEAEETPEGAASAANDDATVLPTVAAS